MPNRHGAGLLDAVLPREIDAVALGELALAEAGLLAREAHVPRRDTRIELCVGRGRIV